MNTFWQILRYDWRQLARSKNLKIISVLALVLGAYAIFYGKNQLNRQWDTIRTLEQDEKARLDSLHSWASLDTNVVGNKAKWEKATDPYLVNVPEGYRWAIHYPTPTAALSLGMRDLYPFYMDVWGRAIHRHIYQTEIHNPQKLQAGHFDLSFVMVYLLPLLLIALSYNLLSSEKEQGTLALLLSQPIQLSQIILAKLCLRFLISVVFVLIISLIAGLMASLSFSDTLFWTGLSLAYGLFWVSIIFVVVSWHKTSAFNAVALLASWLLLVLVLPALAQQLISLWKPIDRSRLEYLVRDEYSQERPDSVVMKQYYAWYPERTNTDTSSSWHFTRTYYARNEQLDSTLAPYVKNYEAQIKSQESVVKTLNWVLPAANAQDGFNILAATDAAAHRNYIEQIIAFHTQWNEYFVPKKFKDIRLKPTDYQDFPQYNYQSPKRLGDVAWSIAQLLIGALVLVVVGWRGLRSILD